MPYKKKNHLSYPLADVTNISTVTYQLSGKPLVDITQLVYPQTSALFAKYGSKGNFIAKGTFGGVYKLKSLVVTQGEAPAFVIKIMSKNKIARKSLEKEVSFNQLAGISPPNAIYEDAQFYYMVMNEIKGVDLVDFINDKYKHRKEIKPDQLVTIIDNLFAEYEKIHQKGILHLDIKLDNIIIDPDTLKVTIVDFGLSRSYPQTTTENFSTRAAYLANAKVLSDGEGGPVLEYARTAFSARQALESMCFVEMGSPKGTPNYIKYHVIVNENGRETNRLLQGLFSENYALSRVVGYLLDASPLSKQFSADLKSLILQMGSENVFTQKQVKYYRVSLAVIALQNYELKGDDSAAWLSRFLISRIHTGLKVDDLIARVAKKDPFLELYVLIYLCTNSSELLKAFDDNQLECLLESSVDACSMVMVDFIARVEQQKPAFIDYDFLRYRLACNVLFSIPSKVVLTAWAKSAVEAYLEAKPQMLQDKDFKVFVSQLLGSLNLSLGRWAAQIAMPNTGKPSGLAIDPYPAMTLFSSAVTSADLEEVAQEAAVTIGPVISAMT